MSDEQKVYVNGMIVKEHTFTSTGNTILKVSIKAADMIAFLNQHADDRGWCNLGISRRKTPSDKGVTHTVWLDAWKPDPSHQRANGQAAQSYGKAERPVDPSPLPAAQPGDAAEDLPF